MFCRKALWLILEGLALVGSTLIFLHFDFLQNTPGITTFLILMFFELGVILATGLYSSWKDVKKNFDKVISSVFPIVTVLLAMITMQQTTTSTNAQLNISRNQQKTYRQEQQRKQADAFAAWVSKTNGDVSNPVFEVTYKNDSTLPVYQVFYFLVDAENKKFESAKSLENVNPQNIFYFHTIPPTENFFYFRKVDIKGNSINDYTVAMVFKDASGRFWYRNKDGRIRDETNKHKSFQSFLRYIGINKPFTSYKG